MAFGPHMSNFREIARVFLLSGGAIEVSDAEAVERFAAEMFNDAAARQDMGAKAKAVVEANRGAASHTADHIIELLA